MAIRKIEWHDNPNSFPYWYDVNSEYCAIDFDLPGDDYLVFHNDENDEYAVYLKLGLNGTVCSLAKHFDLFSRIVDTDDGFSAKVYELFVDEAVSSGFPKNWHDIQHSMTWRDIRDQLNGIHDDKLLDVEAYVWISKDGIYDDFTPIESLDPFNYDEKADADTNPLSFTLSPIGFKED